MNIYLVLSLMVVFGLLSWWSFLAITAIGRDPSIRQAKCTRLANYLVSIVHIWR